MNEYRRSIRSNFGKMQQHEANENFMCQKREKERKKRGSIYSIPGMSSVIMLQITPQT